MAATLLGSVAAGNSAASSTTPVTHTLAAGAHRKVYVAVPFEDDGSAGIAAMTAWTYGGVEVTEVTTHISQPGGGGTSRQILRLGVVKHANLPADGSNNVVAALAATSNPQGKRTIVWAVQDADQADATVYTNQYSSGTSVLLPSGGNLSAAAGSFFGVAVAVNGDTRLTFAGSGASWTEGDDAAGQSADCGGGVGYVAYASALTDRLTVTMASEQRMAVVGVYDLAAATDPEVSAVDPPEGPAAGGTEVEVQGTNFDATGGSSEGVTIGGSAATGVSFDDASTITATTPAGTPGPANVVVTNGGGATSGASGNGAFFYLGSTAVTTPDPTDGDGETSATVTSTLWNRSGTMARRLRFNGPTCEGMTLPAFAIKLTAPA